MDDGFSSFRKSSLGDSSSDDSWLFGGSEERSCFERKPILVPSPILKGTHPRRKVNSPEKGAGRKLLLQKKRPHQVVNVAAEFMTQPGDAADSTRRSNVGGRSCAKRRKLTCDSGDDPATLAGIAGGHGHRIPSPNAPSESLEARFSKQEQAMQEASIKVNQQTEEIAALRQQLQIQTGLLQKMTEAYQRQFAQQQRQAEKQERQAGDITVILQAVNHLAALSSNTYGLLKTRIDKKSRSQTSSSYPNPELLLQSRPCSTLRIANGKVSIPIGHENIKPGTVYEPVEINVEEYGILRIKSDKVTTFVRGLMKFFFEPEVMRKSNFDGSDVLTKDGHVKKDRLDRRVVLSMIDQAELEFPGQVQGKTAFSKIRSVINDKCRHC